MPNWKTHLEISKELNRVLKYNDKEFELFAFGSILPDVNNGYLVKDVSKIIDHRTTHFKGEDKSYINFYNKYKNIIKEPLIFGYFTHLYTDFNWNKNFYENTKVMHHNEENHDRMREMKQHDFRIYNCKFIKNNTMLDIEYRSTCVYSLIFNNQKEIIENEYKNKPIIK